MSSITWEDVILLLDKLWHIGAGPELAVRMAWACVEARKRVPEAICTRALVADEGGRAVSVEFLWAVVPEEEAREAAGEIKRVLNIAGLRRAEVEARRTEGAVVLRVYMPLGQIAQRA